MRSRILVAIAGGLFLGSLVPGQTTGVPWINDYTITCTGCATGFSPCWPASAVPGAGGVSGSTSCTPLFFDVSGGGTFTFTVTCAPVATVMIFIDLCPCFPCWLPLPPACGIPFTACGGSTSQSVDLDLTCPFNNLFTGTANTAGLFIVSIALPPIPLGACLRLSSQAAIIGSTSSCAGPLLVSQAYDVYIG